MPLNPLAPVTDYQSMLNRIFWFTTAAALGAIWLLRLQLPALDAALSQLDVTMGLGGEKAWPTQGGCLLPALAIGIVERVFGLHGRISDLLGIRETFDIDVIIAELAQRVGVDLAAFDNGQLRRARHNIMRHTFYRFVSGSQSTVDKQLIHQALEAWSWFWMGVVATPMFSLTAFALITCRAYSAGFQTLCGTLFLATIAIPALHVQCKRYAIAQVRDITADPMRAAAVRAAFDELRAASLERRRAA